MTETGLQIIDAIINNPMEAIILGLGGYIIYKFYFSCEARHRRRYFFRHLGTDIDFHLSMAYYNLFKKSNSFAGLKPHRIDEALKLIRTCSNMSTWGLCYFLQAKMQLSSLDRYRIMKALEDLGKIAIQEQNGESHWREIKN